MDEDIIGTEYYVSPEMLTDKKYSFSSDLWAFGVILYQVYTNQLPFCGKNEDLTFEKIKKGEYQIPLKVPELVKDLIGKLLVLNPLERLGSANIQDLLDHQYFEGVNLNQIKHALPSVGLKLTDQ